MGNAPTNVRGLTQGTQLGSYAVVRLIAEGGMGTVYEGIHQTLGKRVAIKTLHEAFAGTAEVVERFLREGKAAAKIRHPNVVDVIDVALYEGTPYLVMEYLEGEDLGTLLERAAEPMRPEPIADLIVPVISALAAVHAAGIVHRDLKPENIVLARGSNGGLDPKLIDFGISKFKDPDSLHLTGSHVILGTPYYMSPEQAASSKEIDLRSDIFSLGVILYECAAGERPFKARSLLQLLEEIRSLEPAPLRTIVRDVPAVFSQLIMQAMQKDPAQRFQSAAEVGAALLPFASPRVRLNHEREFGDHARRTQGMPLDSLAATNRTAPSAPQRLAGLIALGALVCAGFGLWALRASAPAAQPRAAAAEPAARVEPPDPARFEPLAATRIPNSAEAASAVAPAADAGAAPGVAASRSEWPLRAQAGSRARTKSQRVAARANENASAAAPSAPPPRETPASEDDLFRDRK